MMMVRLALAVTLAAAAAAAKEVRGQSDGHGKDDRRVVLGRNRVQRLQVAQLQGKPF